MFKNNYLKEIIPDIILFVGIIILLAGIFILTGFDYFLGRDPLITEEKLTAGLGTESVSDPELIVLEQKQERNKKRIVQEAEKGSNKGNEIIDSELLLTIQDKPELIKNYFTKGDFSVDLAVKSFKKISNNRDKYKGEMINILIPEGSSGLRVARILDQSNLISYQDFRQLLSLFDIETRIKAGSYSFEANSSVSDILTKILIK